MALNDLPWPLRSYFILQEKIMCQSPPVVFLWDVGELSLLRSSNVQLESCFQCFIVKYEKPNI